MRLEGNLHPFMANLLYFKDVIAAPTQGSRARNPTMSPRLEPILGCYLNLDLLGKPHRLYVEEAGQGIPLLCLHTAGSDTRQYRGVMNDARVTKNFRVIAFDMPWHGKSSPPAGWQDTEYQLTSRDYVRMIVEVADALDLARPVVMGCSIGGRIVLHLAREHPERFRALIGLESAAHTEPYYDLNWLDRPDVHGGMVCSRRRLRPDRAERAGGLRAGKRCGTTCRAGPACSRATFISIPRTATSAANSARSTSSAARFFCSPANTTIPAPPKGRSRSPSAPARRPPSCRGFGHFPMSEDPEKFISYLLPVLEKIRAL